MKNSIVIPLIILLVLVGILAYSFLPSHPAVTKPGADTAPTGEIAPIGTKTNTADAANSTIAGANALADSQSIVSPPPATTTTSTIQSAATVPDSQPAATTATISSNPSATQTIVMPATVPAAPKNFYPVEMATNSDYQLHFRAGYEHASQGDNHDSYWLSAEFSAHNDRWRQSAGKNAWLVPDAEAEISHQELPKNHGSVHAGTGQGMEAEGNLTWPWFDWVLHSGGRVKDFCPFTGPMMFTLGPTANAGGQKRFDGTTAQFFSHGGARLTLNRDAYIEYTFGGQQNLGGTRQQLVAELPFYQSRDGQVRYLVRGLWDHAAGSHPELLQGAVFVEMPFGFLVTPRQWADLIPFTK